SLLALFFLVLISSCEDVIQVDLPEGESQLCVDGILTNDTGVQVIKLRMTQGYLDNAPLRPASGAVVRVTDLGNRIWSCRLRLCNHAPSHPRILQSRYVPWCRFCYARNE
ncbi:MAG: DUF4249 family protein, partial [Actinobacteria bacterium]|nr:DUF4249 family protein [Actinomycetota bacterium]